MGFLTYDFGKVVEAFAAVAFARFFMLRGSYTHSAPLQMQMSLNWVFPRVLLSLFMKMNVI